MIDDGSSDHTGGDYKKTGLSLYKPCEKPRNIQGSSDRNESDERVFI